MAEETALVAKKHRRKKVLLIVGVVVLIVVAAGAGVALRWWQTRDKAPQDNPTPTLATQAGNLQNLRDTGSEEEFNTQVDEILADPNLDDETRYQVLLQQGHNAADNEDWSAAIEAYTKAEQLQATYEVAGLLAEVYRGAGNTTKAIEYYQKAIDRMPQDNPVGSTDREVLEQHIRDLEAQQ